MTVIQSGNPLSYLGVKAAFPPNIISLTSAPTTTTQAVLGDIAIVAGASSYQLVSVSGATFTWALLGGGSSDVNTINNLLPTAGNITIAGTAAQVAVGNAGSTVTLSLTGPYTPATYTNHGVLVGAAASSITALGAASTGSVLAGVTGADPAFTATPSVTTLTATTVHGTTIDTNVAAAQLSLNGTTMTATGSNTDVSMNLATKGTGSIVMSRSAAGVDLNMQITNSDNTATSSPAGIQLAVGGSTNTGDPYTQYAVSGATTWTTGIDNSASDAYVVAASNALGTSNAASWSTAGALTNSGAVTVTAGNVIASNGQFVGSTAGTGFQFNANTATGIAANPIVLNSRAGAAVFTTVSIAAAADLTLTITNSAITGSSTQVIYSMSGATTGSAPSIKSVTNSAGSSAVVVTNGTGATTTTADITLTFLVVN